MPPATTDIGFPLIISHAVWVYHRFCLSFRDAEDLLAQRGITCITAPGGACKAPFLSAGDGF